MMYRTVPHSTTGVSPAKLMFGRKLRTRLPCIEENTVDDLDVRYRDNETKEKGKIYIDKKRQAKTSNLKEGDKVLLRQKSLSKLTPPFDPHPYRVVSKYGNSVMLESSSGVKAHATILKMGGGPYSRGC